jgi:hypothetical protein
MADRVNEIVYILIHEPIRPDDPLNLGFGTLGRDELGSRRHVDAIDVGITHGRGRRGHIDLARAGLARHLDDLLGRGTPNDRIVDEQHVLAFEFEIDSIELAPYRGAAFRLLGHDERAADIAVLDESLAVLHAETMGDLHRRGARSVGDRDHDVDVVIGTQSQNLGG